MRDGESSGPAASSSLVDDVRALAAESGLPVRLSFDLQDAVPQELARSVLRLVQESLTNIIKHSGASHAAVHLDHQGEHRFVDGRNKSGHDDTMRDQLRERLPPPLLHRCVFHPLQ